ncbi:MAG: DUF4375 domain-containing protein [Gemmatimonadetes bacterium]|nr:DUF4375 domain-containing protein [Gemmatimonadota bacterium]MBK7785773.1 DUF4375 domain-containing protein [Gemmatimonadota bacterium]MBK9067106.1 DUF4375 domain-containing protein [Gemmatimonadota bacterium]
MFAAHWCQSEVYNGGLRQFFDNSTGVLAPEAVTGFRAVGMPKTAALLERAMLFFGSSYPRERADRERALAATENDDEELPNPFETMDVELFTLLDTEADGWEKAARRYAAANAG